MGISNNIDKTGFPFGTAGNIIRGYAGAGEYAYTTSLPAGVYVGKVLGSINGTGATGGINMNSNPDIAFASGADNIAYYETTVAETGTVFYVNWTTRLLNTGQTATGIAYGNVGGVGTYVAVGQSASAATSTDLITWTSRTTNFGSSNIQCVSYSDNATTKQFIAGGAGGTMGFSTDGIVWTAVTTSGFGTSQIQAVANNGSIALWGGVSGSSNQQLRYNSLPLTAGTTSTLVTNTFGTSTVFGIAFGTIGGTSRWVAVGAGGRIEYATGATPSTTTVATWSGTAPTTQLNGVAYSNAGTYKFVAVGASATVAVSTDGITWTTTGVTPNFGTSTISAVVYNPDTSRWYISGAGGTLRASTDGLTWNARITATTSSIPALTYGSATGICATSQSNAVAPQGAIIGLWITNLPVLN